MRILAPLGALLEEQITRLTVSPVLVRRSMRRGEERPRRTPHRGTIRRNLAQGAAGLRSEMGAVNIDEPLLCDRPQPDHEGLLGLFDQVAQAISSIEERLLHDVARVDPAPEAAVHAEGDHPPQSCAIELEELRESVLVALANLFEPTLFVRRF